MQINIRKKAAFFDVDGTIISTKSLISFAQYLEKTDTQEIKLHSMSLFLEKLYVKFDEQVPRYELNRHYFSIYKGLSKSAIERAAKKWFLGMEQTNKFYIQKSISEMMRLKIEGYTIVLVTGSFLPLLQPLNERFEIDDILNTTLECIDDNYTGELIGNPCIGENKRARILQYALENNVDLANSWAFGDDESDLPMLQSVGNGVKVESDVA